MQDFVDTYQEHLQQIDEDDEDTVVDIEQQQRGGDKKPQLLFLP
jgi:hypothetical protein